MEFFQYSQSKANGTYLLNKDNVPIVYCPDCGNPIVLGAKYKVESNGRVIPGIHCVYPGCAFRDFGKLEAWNRVHRGQ